MKFKTNLYVITRVTFGMLLVLYSVYNVIKYSGFLERLDKYFSTATIFDIAAVEALAPLVPFEEFLIGFFLVMGLFTRKILIAATILFGFFTIFLFDAGHIYCALLHSILLIVSIILLKKNNYDMDSLNYSRDSYQVIQ